MSKTLMAHWKEHSRPGQSTRCRFHTWPARGSPACPTNTGYSVYCTCRRPYQCTLLRPINVKGKTRQGSCRPPVVDAPGLNTGDRSPHRAARQECVRPEGGHGESHCCEGLYGDSAKCSIRLPCKPHPLRFGQ